MREITVLLFLCLFVSEKSPGAHLSGASAATVEEEQTAWIIPFGIVSRLITIEAEINGVSGYLCIDTGLDGLVLNRRYFDAGRAESDLHANNGMPITTKRAFANVQFAGIARRYADARVIGLDDLFPNQSTQILGVVGWEVFTGYELQVNFREKLLKLYQLDKQGNRYVPDEMSPPASIVPLRFKGPLLMIEGRLGPQRLDLILDTGASVNLLTRNVYKRVSPSSTYLRQVQIRDWSSSSMEKPVILISGMTIGMLELNPMQTTWADLMHLNWDLSGMQIDGVIGQEALRQYIVGFNFVKKEVSFYAYDEEKPVAEELAQTVN